MSPFHRVQSFWIESTRWLGGVRFVGEVGLSRTGVLSLGSVGSAGVRYSGWLVPLERVL